MQAETTNNSNRRMMKETANLLASHLRTSTHIKYGAFSLEFNRTNSSSGMCTTRYKPLPIGKHTPAPFAHMPCTTL
jgi:hypothetical protein